MANMCLIFLLAMFYTTNYGHALIIEPIDIATPGSLLEGVF